LNKKQTKHRPQLVIRKVGASLLSLKRNKWKYTKALFDKLFDMPATSSKQGTAAVGGD
jgi:hypothetical protein